MNEVVDVCRIFTSNNLKDEILEEERRRVSNVAQQVQVLSAKPNDHMCDPWNTNDRKGEQTKSKLFPDPDLSIMELRCLHIFTW